MTKKKGTHPLSRFCYRVIHRLVVFFYPQTTVEGIEHLPENGCVVVGNHAQMNGPIIGEIYFPGQRVIWCAWQMMHLKEVPAYAYQDFWSAKPQYIRWFYRFLSYLIAPISACIFNNSHTIAVYHDSRILSTFRQTITALSENKKVIIFPECYEPHNHIVNHFQDKFIDIARLYYKRTGKALSFVPMYVAPKLKKVCLGKPIVFQPEEPMEQERDRICNYLMDEITDMAIHLPEHKVVPYANIPAREYPDSRSKKES